MRVFTCQQCEYCSSGSDVSVNAVIIPQNWGAIPFFGALPLRRYCPPILRNDDRIHRYILPRTTVFPQSVVMHLPTFLFVSLITHLIKSQLKCLISINGIKCKPVGKIVGQPLERKGRRGSGGSGVALTRFRRVIFSKKSNLKFICFIIKGGLISESFPLWLKSQEKGAKSLPLGSLLKLDMLIWHFSGDVSQSEKLSEL
jgi:hypothetical protein